MKNGYIKTLLSLVFGLVALVKSSPISNSGAVTERIDAKEIPYAMNFMQKYGYVTPPDPRLGQLRNEKELVQGIEHFQRFSGIKMTGKLNRETLNVMKKPRCGLPDFGPSDNMRRKKRFALDGSRWMKNDLTYIKLNNPTYSEVSDAEVGKVLRQAFDMWSKVVPVTFREINEGTADIEIRFVEGQHDDGDPFDGPGGYTAHAFSPREYEGLEGDIHFDDDEHWVLERKMDSTNLYWTAVHEIGHSLGLQHSEFKNAIMYPIQTEDEFKLTEDDIKAIQTIYGKPAVPTTEPKVVPIIDPPGPSVCRTPMDAVFYNKDDGNTYFFKEQQFWILDKYNRTSDALKLQDYWPELRSRVQAVYQRHDGMTVFFKGRRFWVYNGTQHIEGPNEITDYGLPLEMKQIDAVFVFGGNDKTYFFKGHQYWRYNELYKTLDPGYPKNISVGWGNMRQPVDAVMTWKDGASYFFKDLTFQKYDFMSGPSGSPSLNFGKHFMNCPGTLAARSKGTKTAAFSITGLILFPIAVALKIF